MFGGDDEEDEFEFSLASRDSLISASASRDFDRTANSSLDASASGGNAGASKPSKSKKSKSKTERRPGVCQNLSRPSSSTAASIRWNRLRDIVMMCSIEQTKQFCYNWEIIYLALPGVAVVSSA